MNTAAVDSKLPASQSNDPVHSSTSSQNTRETIESIVVAFILAFLFRAFVAEAFVIPTGSMAPTLMGAHKDIVCEICGKQYQASASDEFDSEAGTKSGRLMIGSTCSICRGINAYDLVGNRNHATFSGDRILVSKFDYVLNSPERWDVFVFKFPQKARMNYIKRLVGLPGESLLIRGGDVYVRGKDDQSWTIARKPPDKIKAMRQIVDDTHFQASRLVQQGWPSPWQPWSLDGVADRWSVEQTEDQWSAKLEPSDNEQLLRYYHKVLSEQQWEEVLNGQPLPEIAPKQSQLITDYLAYNSSFEASRNALMDAEGNWTDGIDSDLRPMEWLVERNRKHRINGGGGNQGVHWVGDLVGDFDVEIASDSGTLLLDLVEFGIHFRCQIDVATGETELFATQDGERLPLFGKATSAHGQSKLQGSGSYHVEMANVDDQLVVWVNGSVVSFDQPTTYDSYRFRSEVDRRPYYLDSDPLDAAPLGIGGKNLAMHVKRAKVHRDIYYIAIRGNSYSDYRLNSPAHARSMIPDRAAREEVGSAVQAIFEIYRHPEWWQDTELFRQRGELSFVLGEAQYFPMGDNSSHSSDARAWFGHHYVEEKYLLGKALLVFWPHTWNTPVPFTPNISRMGLIR
jgi:signal peptidase I